MADPNPKAEKPKSNNAFEWLAGGLFFGKRGGGIQSIDSCKDVASLLTGVEENFSVVLQEYNEASAATSTADVASSRSEEMKDDANVAEGSSEFNADPTQSDFLSARLTRLRFLLYEERRNTSKQEHRRSTPTVAAATMQGLTSESGKGLLPSLLENLHVLPFESRKIVAHIFNYLLVSGLDGSDAELYRAVMESFRDYVYVDFDRFMTIFVAGHDVTRHNGSTDVALHCGSMYRSVIRHPSLYQQLVATSERAAKYIFPFLDSYVHLPNFDVASDAMECLRLVFTAGGDMVIDPAAKEAIADMCAEFLNRDYEEVWDNRFNPKLLSDSANYMTRRVALQILSSVLLTRSNYSVMVRFVASKRNLILIMHLLRDTSPHITLDAFHVFKVFVANPNKPPEVEKILKDNQTKLCAYLSTLHQEKEASDTQFRDEKALIIATIEAL